MSSKLAVHIRLSKLSDKEDLIELVNEVYEECEGHLWVEPHQRLSEEGFSSHHGNKELIVAEIPDVIVGCVVMSTVEDGVKHFSMLVIRPEYRRLGIGRMLVDFVVESARREGCKCVRVDSLYSSDQPDPWKQILIKWYKSLGFQFVRNADFADEYPYFVANLAVETTNSIFEKSLEC